MKDLAQNTIQARAIKPDVHAVSTVTGVAVDCKHARKGLLYIDVGAVATGAKLNVTITECATADGTFTLHTTVAEIDAAGQTQVEFKNFKRYIKAVAVVTVDTVEAAASFTVGDLRESKNLIS